MSAALVCGKRSPSSFFEDEYNLTPHPSSKRVRWSSSHHFSSPSYAVSSSLVVGSPFERLRALFPDMDQQLLEKALEQTNNDLDMAIKTLNDLHLESVKKVLDFGETKTNGGSVNNILPPYEGTYSEDGGSQNLPTALNLPSSGSEWVELIVNEMSMASNIDDARARASRVLEGLEKSIVERSTAESAQNFLKENTALKEQVAKLLQEGEIWKRAFKTLHGQKEDFERSIQELHQLRMEMSQRDEQMRKLQVENYQLKLRLVQEQQHNPLPGRFHPDIFG